MDFASLARKDNQYGVSSQLSDGKDNPEYTKRYREKNQEKMSDYSKDYRKKMKRQAFLIVGNGKIQCSECDCNDIDFLELNYKPGGHTRLHRHEKFPVGSFLYESIVKGRINPKDFNILCKPHNAIDHLSSKSKWTIRWMS